MLVVALFVNPGHEAEFEQFESAAAMIMRRHGGAVERRIRCMPHVGDNPPHEVHIVVFPDEQSFERYRNDPDLRTLADLRTRAIRQTMIWRGADVAAFGKSTV